MSLNNAARFEFTAEDERRRARRLQHPMAVHYQCPDAPYRRATVMDISRTGARMKVRGPLEARTPISLLLEFEPGFKVTVDARMVWQKSNQAAVRFSLPSEVEDRLESWIQARS